ncbi:hypothetical protein HSB1_15860 [Halogranum salarium B-1]|uniref:Uncharacterized protein n=1 Tax=Halogranum salarium B-1 TaxID=1210908 RepID=J3A274_9EURY|nr:hypothetical protein HSB1_15860 [Halogranum salarium B-1]
MSSAGLVGRLDATVAVLETPARLIESTRQSVVPSQTRV